MHFGTQAKLFFIVQNSTLEICCQIDDNNLTLFLSFGNVDALAIAAFCQNSQTEMFPMLHREIFDLI